jgi:hypothetical protein
MDEKKVVSRNVAFALGLLCIILVASTIGVAVYSGTLNLGPSQSHSDSEFEALRAQLTAANQNISSLATQIAQLQSELLANSTHSADLQSRVDSLTSQLKAVNDSQSKLTDYYNSQVYIYSTDSHDNAVSLTAANNLIASLQDQINTYNEISNLTVSTVWVNNQTVTQTAGTATSWSESASFAGYAVIQVFSSTTPNTYANVTYSSHGVNYNNQINVGTHGTASFPILPSTNISVAVGNSLASGTATENVTITYFY